MYQELEVDVVVYP